MIKVIPNQVLCKNCMTNLEYESSDVIETITTYPNIEVEPDDRALISVRCVTNGHVEVVKKYIECPICNTKIML